MYLYFALLAVTATWTEPDAIPGSTTVDFTILASNETDTSTLVATWLDSSIGFIPSFATQTSGVWGSSSSIDNSITGAGSTVSVCYYADQTVSLATWQDGTTHTPFYIVGEAGSWLISPTQIPGTSPANFNVYSCYDAAALTIVVTWVNAADSIPYYATFTDGATWSTPAPITDSPAQGDVFVSFNPSMQAVIATWQGEGNIPYYAFWTGSSWEAPRPIPGALAAQGIIATSYDPTSQGTLASWATSAGTPYSALCLGSADAPTWQEPLQISSLGAVGDVFTSFIGQSIGGVTMIATWASDVTSTPQYALLCGSTWGETFSIPGGGETSGDVFPIYNPASEELTILWGQIDSGISAPYFSYATFNLSPINRLTGYQNTNNFGIVSEKYNELLWQSPSAQSLAGYLLSRNNSLLATLPGTEQSYQDHNRNPKKSDTYTLIGFDAEGNQTAPISVTIGGGG